MAVAIKRKKITLILDWMYQTYAISEARNECEELEHLLKSEVKWMRRKKLLNVYNIWVEENKTLPKFKNVEKQLREVIQAF